MKPVGSTSKKDSDSDASKDAKKHEAEDAGTVVVASASISMESDDKGKVVAVEETDAVAVLEELSDTVEGISFTDLLSALNEEGDE